MIAFADPVATLDQTARNRLDPLWKRAGRPGAMTYPVGTPAVLSMLQACDYRVDLPFIVELIGQGVTLVPVVRGQARWDAGHVLQLVGHLERLRRWSWPSAIHAWKFSQLERLQAEAEAAGRPSGFEGFARFDVESLLTLQAEAEQPATREALRTVILAKLKTHAPQA
jgi:hypothetical protein